MENMVDLYRAKNTDTLRKVKTLFLGYRHNRRLNIPATDHEMLVKTVEKYTRLNLRLKNAYLTPLETIVLGFSSIFSYDEIEYMLSIRRSTIKTYELRAKEKLGALSKLHAACLAAQYGLFSF